MPLSPTQRARLHLYELEDEDIVTDTAKPAGCVVSDSIVLMQCTGITGKNGTPFFDGAVTVTRVIPFMTRQTTEKNTANSMTL